MKGSIKSLLRLAGGRDEIQVGREEAKERERGWGRPDCSFWLAKEEVWVYIRSLSFQAEDRTVSRFFQAIQSALGK